MNLDTTIPDQACKAPEFISPKAFSLDLLLDETEGFLYRGIPVASMISERGMVIPLKPLLCSEKDGKDEFFVTEVGGRLTQEGVFKLTAKFFGQATIRSVQLVDGQKFEFVGDCHRPSYPVIQDKAIKQSAVPAPAK